MEDILKQLHEKYFKWWMKISNDITNSPRDSEEIVLSAYMTAWLKKDKFDNKSAIKQYIELVVRSRSIDYVRNVKSQKRKLNTISIDSNYFDDTIPDNSEEAMEYESNYQNALKRIFKIVDSITADRKREVILLFLLGFNSHQISNILGISTSTIYNQKNIALKEIRKILSSCK